MASVIVTTDAINPKARQQLQRAIMELSLALNCAKQNECVVDIAYIYEIFSV